MAQGNPILPPISTPLNEMGVMNSLWSSWFTLVYQILYANLRVALSIPNNTTTAIAQVEPVKGMIVFDSTLNVFKGYDGTQWVTFDTTP